MNQYTCLFFWFGFHDHRWYERSFLRCFHRNRSAVIFTCTGNRITLLLHHIRHIASFSITAFVHTLGHGVYILDFCKVVLVYSSRQIFVVSNVAVFALDIFRFWWNGRGFARFCDANKKERFLANSPWLMTKIFTALHLLTKNRWLK